jgi:2-isopropylmalate synthase
MKDTTSAGKSSNKKLQVLDATLRERTFGVSFSIGEKLSIASQLDALGISYIESPLSSDNPGEVEYLKQVRSFLKGGSQPVLLVPESIPASSFLKDLEGEETEWIKNVSFRANSWKSHLEAEGLKRKLDPDANLTEIKKNLVSLKDEAGKTVFFYAEHFFDGFFEDTSYALSVLEVAIDSGVNKFVLCDSRGASLPEQISKAVKLVHSHFLSKENLSIGIQCHNDLGLAVANTIAAVQSGADHVQGTINGIGDRAGSADLCQLLPLLIYKLGYDVLNSRSPRERQLASLKDLSDKVSAAVGLSQPHQPFVGTFAYAHTDPLHASVELRNPDAFEAVSPALVGNRRLLGVDDASIVQSEMSELGLYTKGRDDVAKKVLTRMRELEAFGCKFEDAKASLHLLILESLGYAIWPFQVTRWETSTSRSINESSMVIGTIEVSVGAQEGRYDKTLTATERGVGPIHAIDLALKKCLEQEFPELKNLKLISYSLNIVDSLSGTAATARARTEFSDEGPTTSLNGPNVSWATTAVSEDVLDASIKALIDGYRYKLIFQSKSSKYSFPDWRVAMSWRETDRW